MACMLDNKIQIACAYQYYRTNIVLLCISDNDIQRVPVINGIPQVRYSTLGLIRAQKAPEIETIIVNREKRLKAAYGAKGCGELATIPTAPSIAGAYYRLDGDFRTKLPMENTYYRKPQTTCRKYKTT